MRHAFLFQLKLLNLLDICFLIILSLHNVRKVHSFIIWGLAVAVAGIFFWAGVISSTGLLKLSVSDFVGFGALQLTPLVPFFLIVILEANFLSFKFFIIFATCALLHLNRRYILDARSFVNLFFILFYLTLTLTSTNTLCVK